MRSQQAALPVSALKSIEKATWQHANPCRSCMVQSQRYQSHAASFKRLAQPGSSYTLSACQDHSPIPSRKQASTDLGLVGMRAAALALFGSASAPAASRVSGGSHTGPQESRLKVQQGGKRTRHTPWESGQGRRSEDATSMCACPQGDLAVICRLAAPCACSVCVHTPDMYSTLLRRHAVCWGPFALSCS
jgi:hypothetical protein